MSGLNCKIEYRIADLKNSLGKDERDYLDYTDHEYTDNNLKIILNEISKKVGNNQVKFEYLRDSMPSLNEMQAIVDDILKFYEKNFLLYNSTRKHRIYLRFFLHVKFLNEDGDACDNSIRISCKNLAEIGNTNSTANKFINEIQYEKKELFLNKLRLVLAHEFYHVFHEMHCSMGEAKFHGDICGQILNEVFANYFAYVYLVDFLKRTNGEEKCINQKRNDVTEWWYEAARYFGIGRKHLFPECFSEEVIEVDKHELQRLAENKYTESITNTRNYPVSKVEYAAGYILAFYGNKQEDGKIGKEMRLYSELYCKYLQGNAKEALLQLIKVKEENYFKYTYSK